MSRKTMFAAALVICGVATSAWADDATHAGDRGEYLARAGDCVACHAVPNGPAFAGGLKMGSPIGAMYSTNITPDPESGIGRYTLQDFDRAVRRGIAKDGHRLYPAMPYPSYAKLSDDDVRALYNFFMREVPPSQHANKPDEIPLPLNFRWPMAIWNLAFNRTGPFVVDRSKSAEWNRGAYLVEGLGHCGACHTPRAITLQEKALDASSATFLAGASLDGWSAANLRGNARTGLGMWSQDDIVAFLKHGSNRFGTAFGSMVDVINNSTPYMSDADIEAIAVFLKSLPATREEPAYVYDNATTNALQGEHFDARGAAIYAANCSSCHGSDGKGFAPYLPPVAGNPTTMDDDPSSLVNLVLNGSAPLVVTGTPDPYRMPQFRVQLSDQQIADVLTFVRAGWGNGAKAVTASQVADLRKTTDPTSDKVTILKMR
jgi:mono/diheme cytochrome c family protein